MKTLFLTEIQEETYNKHVIWVNFNKKNSNKNACVQKGGTKHAYKRQFVHQVIKNEFVSKVDDDE